MESPQGSSFREPGFPVVCHFQRYWADSSKSTVQPKMESCFQDRACSVSSFIWTFGKVISLLFNTLSRFVIAFLPRSKHLLISRLQSPSAVILEPKKIKSTTVSTFPPSICHEVMGLDTMRKGCCWTTQRRWDSWPPEEKNSIWGQRQGLLAQSFCVIKFY